MPPKTDTESTIIQVNQGNLPPVANPGGPYVVDLDNPITLDGSGSSDPNAAAGDSIVSYSWSINSGALILSGITPVLTVAQINTLGVGVHPVSLTVTDEFGSTGIASTTLSIIATPADPQEMTEDLIGVVSSLGLPQGIENSLTSKLSNVIKSLGKGQTDAAINQLNAFINEVQAQSGKKLSEAQASDLVDKAQDIIASL
ncbi:MAG: hypothetical protein Q8O55_00260 [Dehalococcoidales bacterium]|nr:hypothetical protein [Dehalococcoidales bacterium]